MASGHWETRQTYVVVNGKKRATTRRVWVPDPVAKTVQRTRRAGRTYEFGGRKYTSYVQYSAARQAYAAAQKRMQIEAENRRKIIEAQKLARDREVQAKKMQTEADRWGAKQGGYMDPAAVKAREEKKAADDRRKAYDALASRRRMLQWEETDSLREKQRLIRLEQYRQQKLAEQYEAEDSKRAKKQYDPMTARRLHKYGETLTEGEVRRKARIEEAKKTGDFETVYDEIRKRQAETGDRYLDRDLLKAANDEVAKKAKEATDSFVPLYDKAKVYERKWKKTGDRKWLEKGIELVGSKAYKTALKGYMDWYGDGVKPGKLEIFAGKANKIAAANDEYFNRVVFGNYFQSRAFTPEEMKAKQAEIDKLLTRTRYEWDPEEKKSRAVSYKMTMNDFLREVEAQEKQRMQQAQAAYQSRMADYARHGMRLETRVDPADGKEKQYLVNTRQEARHKAMRDQFLSGGIDDKTLDGLIETLTTGKAVDRDRSLRALIDVAQKGFDAKNLEKYGWTKGAGEKGGFEWNRWLRTPEGARYLEDKEKAKDAIWAQLTGQERDKGIGGLFWELGNVPVASELIKGLNIAAGGVGLALRGGLAGATGGGQLVLPDVNLDKLHPDNWNKNYGLFTTKDASGKDVGAERGAVYFDTSDQAKAAEIASVRDMLPLGGPDEFLKDPIKFLEGVGAYGAQPARGNAALLLSAALDPTIALGPGRALAAGRLATTRASALGRSFSAATLAEVTTDATRLMLPKSLGGFGFDAYKNRLLLENVSNKVGRYIGGWDELTEADKLSLAADLVGAKSKGQVMGILGKFFKRDQINAEQLLVEIQRYARNASGGLGVVASDAVELAKDIARTSKSLERAERLAKSSAAQAKRLADEAKGAQQLDLARARREVATGVTAPPRAPAPTVTVGVVRARTRLERRIDRLIGERTALAREAADAARVLRESDDFAARRLAATRLRTALGSLQGYEDRVAYTPSGAPSFVPGSIRRQRDVLDAFDRNYGTSSKPPGFMNVTLARVADDRVWLTNELNMARARLGTALTPGQKLYWQRRMRNVAAAMRYLDVEERALNGQDDVVQRVVREHTREATAAIAPTRIATKALTRMQAAEELGRAVHKRLADVERVEAMPAVPDVLRNAADQVAYDARLTPVDWGAHPALTAVRAETGDVNLFRLVEALEEVKATTRTGLYDDALDAAREQLKPVIATQFPAGTTVADFLDVYRTMHNVDGQLSLRGFRRIEKRVQREIQMARQWVNQGTVKLTEASRQPPGLRSLGTRDSELAVVLAKLKVLEDEGISLAMYDEARGAVGDIVVRYNVQSSLRREAMTTARATGRSLDEAFLSAREARRTREAKYNLEAFASRPEMAGLSADEIWLLFEETFLDTDLAARQGLTVTPFQDRMLREAFKEITGGIEATDRHGAATFLTRSNAPPLGNRAAMREWLVENGFWTPRTAEAIREGRTVWSIADERKFWEASYGYTPPWTDAAVLKPLLDDPEAYAKALREWGFFEDEFDIVALGHNYRGAEKLRSIAFGTDVIKRGRTRDELREWFYERYGDLVAERDPTTGLLTFKSVPWLMDIEREYVPWVRRMFSDGYETPRLLQRHGLVINRELLRADQIMAFGDAMGKAVERRLARWLDEGWLQHGEEFLPQEQLLFAYDVVNELMINPKWRGIFAKAPPGARLLGLVGSLMRFPTVWNPAFPTMNIIDRIGFKNWMIAFTSTWGKWSVDQSDLAKRAFPDVESLPGSRSATWYLREQGGLAVAADKMLPATTRARGFVQGITESPLRVSKLAEDSLRLRFARSIYDDAYKIAKGNGADDLAADLAARGQVKASLHIYFPSLEDASDWEKALNQIIPFFSYNMRNKLLGLRLAIGHPWLLLTAEKIGDMIEDRNREIWEEEHPGVPFPEGEGTSRQIWFRDGEGVIHTIDLGNFSDYFRGMEFATREMSWDKALGSLLRVPHPTQSVWLAWMFGWNNGMTPWGTKATPADTFFFMSIWDWMQKKGQFDPSNPKYLDGMQFMSKMLFWQAFGRIDPIKAKVQWFFFLMEQGDEDAAWEYYRANPDLEQYFSLDGPEHRIETGVKRYTWFRGKTPEQIEQYEQAMAEYTALKQRWDDTLDQWYMEPWSDEYRAAKALRRADMANFLRNHPILADVWSYYNTTAEWLEIMDDWVVDLQMEEYFALDTKMPTREQYKSELAFQKALQQFFRDKQAWLKAHPGVLERLAYSRNAAERAWKDHQLQWAEILDYQATLKIQILQEEQKAHPDRELIGFLYDMRDAGYARLDAEAYADVYSAMDGDIAEYKDKMKGNDRLLNQIGNWFSDRVTHRLILPGRSDRYRDSLSPDDRKKYDEEQKYFQALGYAAETAKSGKEFYDILRSKGYLDDYFRKNPDKAAAYREGRAYFNYMKTWVGFLERDQFDAAKRYWDRLPDWVKNRYFKAHPEKRGKAFRGSAYYNYMGGWVKLLKAKDYVAAKKYWDALPAWVRERYYSNHPDQRAKNELSNEILRMGAEYFLAEGDDKLAILRKYPQLRDFLKRYGGREAEFRGLIMAIYRSIPKEDAWLKRKFEERYPEIFSDEAEGERRLRRVAEFIAAHPGFADEYEAALKANYEAYAEQLKHEKQPPKPLEMDRKRRYRKRRKRRAAAFHSSWRLHESLR